MNNIDQIRKKISVSINNLAFIDSVGEQIRMSRLFQERMKGKMPLLAEMYEKSEKEIGTIIFRTMAKSMDVRGLGEGKQLYERYDDECIDRLIKGEKEYMNTEKGRELSFWIDELYVPTTMAVKCRIVDYISRVNYKESIHSLYKKAKEGDEESLFKIVKIDKTVMLTEWAKELIKEKQHNADWEFFKKLGKKIAEEPFKGSYPLVKAEIIAKEFWDELKEMKYKEIWELFVEKELIAREMNLSAFKMFLNRAGLKKYSKKCNKN